MDAMGAAIRVDVRGPEVMRVLPRTNETINEEWISDKTRYAVDGLMRQRLDQPILRVKGKLAAATWTDAFAAIEAKLKCADPKRVGVIAGDLQDAESMKAALDLFRSLGVANIDCRQDGSALGGGARESYLFNSAIAGLDQADAILLVGSNPRLEAPVLNARIRKNYLSRGVKVGVIGERAELTYPYEYLGAGPGTLKLAAGHDFAKVLKDAKNPAIIVGQGAFARPDGAAVLRSSRPSPPNSASCVRAGTASTCCTPLPPASAASTSASSRATAVSTRVA